MTASPKVLPAYWTNRFPWGTALAAGLALLVFTSRSLEARMVFERTRILQGEAWRLWTGNWVHFSPSHLLWNLAVLIPAGAWAEQLAPDRTRRFFLFAPFIIGGTLLLVDPSLARYGGLSGLAAGLLVLLALEQISHGSPDRWFWWAVLALLGLKVAVEFSAGRTLLARFSDPALHPAPLAHVAGIFAAMLGRFRRRRI